MSSIQYDASLNVSQLESAIKGSNKTIGKWVEETVHSAEVIDQAFSKITIKAKDPLKEQLKLITTLQKELDKFEAKLKKDIPGISQEALNKALLESQTKLTEEKRKFLEMQDKSISQNEKEETSQNKIIESLKKWGLGLFTVSGVIKAFKEIIASSNALTEEFGFTISGVKGALQSFFQSFSPITNQTGNIITNMVNAFKNAKELSKAIDAYNDSMQSNQVLEAKEVEILKQKEAIFRNASNITKQRERALNEWVAIRKEAAARELKIEQDLNAALIKEIKAREGLGDITTKQIISFTEIYATNSDLVQKAEEYWKSLQGATAAGYGVGVSEKTRKYYDDLKKQIEALIPVGMTWDDVMASARINIALSDDQINALRESFKRLYITQGGGAAVEAETARWLGSIINKGAAAERKLNDIKLQIDELTTSLAIANESERKGIAEKIILLEKELKLQQDIVNAALMAATIKETPPSKITGVKAPTLLPGGLKMPDTSILKKPKPSTDYIPGTVILTEQGMDRLKKKEAKYDKERLDNLNKELELRNQIVNAAINLIYQIGQQVGLEGKELDQLNSYLNAFSQFASGDIPGAVMSMVSSVIIAFPNAAERYANEIERLNGLLADQQRLIEISERKGGKQEALAGATDIAEQTLKVNEEALARAEYKLRHSQGGIFFSKRMKDVKELTQAVKDSKIAVEEAQQAMDEFLTGGATENTIADAISQGFQEGKTSAADFADTFNGFMIQAINAALTEMSKPGIAAWYKQFAIDIESGGGLSKEEIDALKIDWDKIIAEGKANRDAVEKVTGVKLNTDTTNTGMIGTIQRSITEETGTEWVGLARRQADDLRTMKDYTFLGINNLTKIEANTYGSWQELIIVNTKLDSVIANTKPVYIGDL